MSSQVSEHAFETYVERDPMTNSSLRARFGIAEQNSAIASRIIRDSLEDGRVNLKRKMARVVETFFNHGLHGLKRITRKIRPQSICSLAHPNGVFQIIHNSFLIRAFRAFRGFYFPS